MNHPIPSPQGDNDGFVSTLRAAKAGDGEAINRLFELFYTQVSQMVHVSLAQDMRLNRPWLTAQFSTGDVVQEVFRSVLGDLGSFGGSTERAFAGYLSMVVRNRIIDAIRYHEADRRDGRLRANVDAEYVEEASGDDPVLDASAAEQLATFETAMQALPERERLLLRARLEETASFQELTERLGYSSQSAARRAFFSAQAKLAVMLHASGDFENPFKAADPSGSDSDASGASQ